MIEARARYIVEPTQAGWKICRVSLEGGLSDDFHAIVHRRRDVAEAYAQSSAALERYLASLDAREDSAELFEEWRDLDDRYETLSLSLHDAPIDSPSVIGAALSVEPNSTLH